MDAQRRDRTKQGGPLRRWRGWTLAAGLAALAVAGCGGGEDPQTTPAADTPARAQTFPVGLAWSAPGD
ncbi:hypothetical protein, partial [Ideonella livida]